MNYDEWHEKRRQLPLLERLEKIERHLFENLHEEIKEGILHGGMSKQQLLRWIEKLLFGNDDGCY